MYGASRCAGGEGGARVENLRASVADKLGGREIQFEDRGSPFGIGCAARCGDLFLSCGVSFSETSVRVEVLSVNVPSLLGASEQVLRTVTESLTVLTERVSGGAYFLHPTMAVPAVHSEVAFNAESSYEEVADEVVNLVVDLFRSYCSNVDFFTSVDFGSSPNQRGTGSDMELS